MQNTSSSLLDIQRFSALLRSKRGSRGLREVAQEISTNIGKVSASTLSRIEQENVPDLETFMLLCNWLGVTADEFRSSQGEQQPPTPVSEVIEAHLRADRTLPPDAIDALAKMIRFAYNSVKQDNLPREGPK